MNSNIDKFSIRYELIDTLKFLGIFAIYLGHFADKAGKLYLFVFSYHVPLFFFISGFFALKDREKGVFEYIQKKFKQLMIPYICFALLNVIFYAILRDMSAIDTLKMLEPYLFGIRNTLVASGLWFIPCIFIVNIVYFTLYKLLKNKHLLLAFVVISFIIAIIALPKEPSWFMNIDSAMYYILYYAMGDLLFQYIVNFNFEKSKPIIKILFVFGTIMSVILTAITYFKGSSAAMDVIHVMFKFLDCIPLIYMYHSIFLTLNIIYFNIIIAYLIKNIHVLNEIGRNTLTLCGVENITKLSIETIASIFGLSIVLNNPLACIFYTGICLWVGNYIVSKCVLKNLINPILKQIKL